jgi:hypothetical protein
MNISVKVGTKFRRLVVVAQSVQFACGPRAAEFVLMRRRVTLTGRSTYRQNELLATCLYSALSVAFNTIIKSGVRTV